ncbi:MAG TPA: FtsX-like permease family protein, partial [Blastocatellia bacterium]|nr:FtsX-like permease family protein [Blastocatellia bacterium]
GRDFTAGDDAGSVPVAIVNKKMADTFWPNEEPLGKRFKLGAPGNSRPWLTIVGVASDIPHGSLTAAVKPDWYAPLAQEPARNAFILVRTSGNDADLAGAIRRSVLNVDRDQPLGRVATMEDVLDGSIAKPRFRTVLVAGFAATALLLAVMGLYGLISNDVSQRTTEIGIRLALGARPGDVLRLILFEGLALALAGAAIGLGAALLLARLLSDLLWRVNATDPATFLSVGVFSIVVATLATYLPAWRATRLDPAAALRNE